MAFKIDADVVVFLATVFSIVTGALPRLRRNAARVPVDARLEEVSELSLTPAQQELFAKYDRELGNLGFYPTCTYRWTNFGRNLTRSYLCPGYTARCVIMLVEMAIETGGKRHVSHSAVIEFDTYFSDGTALFTSNMKPKSLLTRPDSLISQRTASDSPTVIKHLHDSGLARISAVPLTPPSQSRDVFAVLVKEHKMLCEHRVQAGEFRLSPDGTRYMTTDKVHWRGIRNFLSPFGVRFSLWQLVAALLAAVSMPTLQKPVLLRCADLINFLPHPVAASLATILSALVTGALIGFVLDHNTFIWTFLLVTGSMWAFHVPPNLSGVFAGYAAHAIRQWKQRRRIVLLPEATTQSTAAEGFGAGAHSVQPAEWK